MNVIEAARIIRLVRLGFKLALAKGIIIAHARAAMAACNIKFHHLIKVTMSCPGSIWYRPTDSPISCLAKALFSLCDNIHETM